MQSSKRYHPVLVTVHWLMALPVFVSKFTYPLYGVGSVKAALSRPAHQRVTPAVETVGKVGKLTTKSM